MKNHNDNLSIKWSILKQKSLYFIEVGETSEVMELNKRYAAAFKNMLHDGENSPYLEKEHSSFVIGETKICFQFSFTFLS